MRFRCVVMRADTKITQTLNNVIRIFRLAKKTRGDYSCSLQYRCPIAVVVTIAARVKATPAVSFHASKSPVLQIFVPCL
jgi:hypothetical protein